MRRLAILTVPIPGLRIIFQAAPYLVGAACCFAGYHVYQWSAFMWVGIMLTYAGLGRLIFTSIDQVSTMAHAWFLRSGYLRLPAGLLAILSERRRLLGRDEE